MIEELRERGLITHDDAAPEPHPGRHVLAERAVTARRELLSETLDDDSAGRDPAVGDLLQRLARELCGEPPSRGDAPELSPAGAPA